ADMPVRDIPEAIRHWLARIGDVYRLDGLSLARLNSEGDPDGRCSWPEDVHRSLNAQRRRLPYLNSHLRTGTLLISEDIDHLPPEATPDGDVLRSLQFGALLAAPFRVNDDRFGLIAFSRPKRAWNAPVIYQLTVLGRILGATLSRISLETRWRSSEQELDAVLTAMPGMAAVVDRSSRIVRANLRWRSRTRRGFHLFRNARVGMRFLEVLAAEEAQSDRQAGNIRRGLLSVLGGDRASFSANYHHAANGGNGGDHYHSRIRPVTEPDGGAVVVFTETAEPDETLK